jgi:hypothetical protein
VLAIEVFDPDRPDFEKMRNEALCSLGADDPMKMEFDGAHNGSCQTRFSEGSG